ncbi:coiled-coil domain-containing protein 24-like [Physella acuta]|uniref:coiled-coil domain-containing protein 24-like n=1 Tax=Physella acuta TaxID=109671 RepID=UPI0027DDF0C9|nr:coiled-coil domain-containing protein 24-like [Physella acuta]
MQAYTKPLSLWQLVEQNVQVHERDEIKEMLGSSLVEQSLELHQEISMLLEIWRDMRDEQNDLTHSPTTLPEPPNLRDRLVQEICFFVENVKEKAKQKGIDPQHILKKHNPEILGYATEMTRPGSSLSKTSRSSDGRETPMVPISTHRQSLADELTGEVESVNKQLNYLDFHQVCLSLRRTLEQEIDQLIEDIQFLHTCLDTEVDIRDCVTPRLASREPTLTELREERSLLEKELLATGSLTATPDVHKPKFGSETILPKTPSREMSPPHRPGSSRVGPLRARHDIDLTSPPPKSELLSPVSTISTSSMTRLTDSTSMTRLADSTSMTRLADSKTLTSAGLVPVASRSDSSVSRQPAPPRSAHCGATLSSSGTVLLGAKKRTISPARVRVVRVSNIVDDQLSKGDHSQHLINFSSPSLSSSPSPSSSEEVLRASGAHADRFRKMVLECRDGE